MSKALAGQTVRIASESQAANLAAYLLADLGATVTRVPAGRAAEIVDAGGDPSAALAVLSGYGPHGPYAGAPAHHSAVEAVAGAHIAQYTYEPGPAYLVSPYSTVGQALLTTAATIAGRLGAGGGPTPVSGVQGLMAVNSGFYTFGAEIDPHRFAHSPRGQSPTYSTYRAADDWLFVGASTTSFMIKVLQALELDDVLADPRTHEGPRAFRNNDLGKEVWARIEPIIAARPRDHWQRVFEGVKVPVGPILSMEEALAHPQIAAGGLAEPGEPVGRLQHSVTVERHGNGTPRTPRTLGPLPLSGLRVVELAGYIAGPYCGRILTDLGAEVVHVEPLDADPFRGNGYGFSAWNHGKLDLSLNLRDAGDRARLLGLVREADIVVTNYRPDALARMGVGRDTMFEVNPGLIHMTLSAYGETGPIAHLPGFDPVVQGFAGIMKRQGGAGEPVKPQMAATDYLSGMLGAIGVLAARAAQLERGGGYIVRTSLFAAALLLNYEAYEDVRAGRPYVIGGRDFKGPHPLNGLHQTADGWILTVVPEPPATAGAEAARAYLADRAALRGDTRATAIARLAAWGIPAVPALDPEAEMTRDPHFLENGYWLRFEQPGLGELTLPAPVLGAKLDRTPAPELGQHNEVDLWGVPAAARACPPRRPVAARSSAARANRDVRTAGVENAGRRVATSTAPRPTGRRAGDSRTSPRSRGGCGP
jgi:crotonobetainyl-CoA:carnitine CoA-transferase CaiB-like acyl-CoA transferase